MIEGLKPYPEYRNSGLPWLGKVPEHWLFPRLKTVLRERVQKGFPNEPMLAATQTKGVVKKEHFENRTVLAMKDFHLLKLVEKLDFVISLRSFQGGIEFARDRGIISPAYTVLYPADPSMHGFLAQFFKSKPFVESLSLFVTGIRQGQNIDYSKLSTSRIPLPPADEQRAIVRFLDHAERKIRRYIAAKRKLVKLLEEEKQAIIHRAVTRGLDPNVPLKPSGLEWVGDIPEHWEVLMAQRIFKENIRPYKGGDETQLSLSQKDGLIPTANMKERSLQTSSFDNWKITLPGDLVLNRFKAHLGVFFATTLRGIVSFHYGVFASRRKLVPKYFEHLFHTEPYRAIFAGRSNGMTIGLQNLSNQNFYGARLPFPPEAEQKAIVELVDREVADCVSAISAVLREIDLLSEYRMRLTSDIVTGKLDVREAAAALPDELDDTLPDVEEEVLPDEEAEDVEREEEAA